MKKNNINLDSTIFNKNKGNNDNNNMKIIKRNF